MLNHKGSILIITYSVIILPLLLAGVFFAQAWKGKLFSISEKECSQLSETSTSQGIFGVFRQQKQPEAVAEARDSNHPRLIGSCRRRPFGGQTFGHHCTGCGPAVKKSKDLNSEWFKVCSNAPANPRVASI